MRRLDTVSWDDWILYHETIRYYIMRRFDTISRDNWILYHETIRYYIMRRFDTISWDDSTLYQLYHETIRYYLMRRFDTISWDDSTLSHETKLYRLMRCLGNRLTAVHAIISWGDLKSTHEVMINRITASSQKSGYMSRFPYRLMRRLKKSSHETIPSHETIKNRLMSSVSRCDVVLFRTILGRPKNN